MKKFTHALLASALFTSAASATEISAAPATSAPFSGFYAGALLGYGSGKGTTDTTVTANGTIIDQRHIGTSMNGINAGFSLGYGKALGSSKVYLGLDLAFTFDKSKGKTIIDTFSLEIRRKNTLEASARLGLVYGAAMPFIKVGWASSKIEGIATLNNFSQQYLNKRLNAFVAGAGIDMKLTPHVIVGLEYVYTSFAKSGKLISPVPQLPVSDANNANLKTKLYDNTVRFKIAYQF